MQRKREDISYTGRKVMIQFGDKNWYPGKVGGKIPGTSKYIFIFEDGEKHTLNPYEEEFEKKVLKWV